jgi:hypothetical protein
VEIRYTLTIPEFKEAYGVMLRRASAYYRFYYWSVTWLGLLIGFVLLFLALLLFSVPNPNQPLVFLLVVIAVVNILAPLRHRGTIRRNYRMQHLNGEILVSAGADGMTVARMNKDIATRYGWTAIEQSAESKKTLVLFPTRLQFVPIPKRAMTPEQQTEFRALVAAHIPQRGSR